MLNKCSFESTFQYAVLIFHKHFCAFFDQDADNGCSQICNLFVLVGNQTEDLVHSCFLFFTQEKLIEFFGFSWSQKLQLVSVFNVHHLVADVVGGFYEKY